MKKNVISIAPDARLLRAYELIIHDVEHTFEDIRGELLRGGYEGTPTQVRQAAFSAGWLECVERSKFDSIESPAREMLADVAVAKVAGLAARLEELRQKVVSACVRYDEVIHPLRLTTSDVEAKGGKLRVKDTRREKFIDDMTRKLTDDEMDAYVKFATIIPVCKELKARGWHVQRIIDDAVGHFDFMPGFDLNGEALVKAVVTYRKKTNK